MKNKIVAACLILLLAVSVLAMAPNRGSHRSATTLDTDTWIDANKILMFVTNKGSFAYDQGGFLGKNDGLYFPFTSVDDINSGTNTNSVIFASGIWLGGIDGATGDTIVTVAEYSDDFWPGPMENGTFIAGTDIASEYRVYKLYSDSLADNPNNAYTDWPVGQGAPVDAEGNPAMMGDQMLWAVYNDANPLPHTNDASSAEGLGVEIRQTTFAFSREGALANIVFVRFRIYNNGNRDIQDMFVSLWADPDLGDAGDDFVGSDVDLSLGYCYNDGDDASYGSRPPAVGYDFFQGPLVLTGSDADTATMWDFTKFPGYQNMPMTSFNKYINGTDPQDFVQAYQYMNGLDASNLGEPVTDPATGDTTKFYGNGDPVAGTGFIDVNASDRRYMLSTGPFDFAPGDSTEIVAAIIVGQGANRLASITELKSLDAFAQGVYDAEFQLPSPPTSPDVTVTELDGEISLNWGTAPEDEPGDYQFEGYTLLQSSSPSGPWDDTLGWWDMANGLAGIIDFRFDATVQREVEYVVKPGKDLGLNHSYYTARDVSGGGPLNNYTEYFYRLEAYSFDTLQPGGQKTLTSATIVTAMPQPPLVGTDLNSGTGDTLVLTHTGPSDGSAAVEIVDPVAVTGDNYMVVFEESPTLGAVWHLLNTTTNDTVLINQTNQGAAGADQFLVVEGMLVKVGGPPLEGKDWDYASASPLNVSPVAAADNGYTGGARWFTGGDDGGELLFGGVFMEPNFWGLTSLSGADYKTVEIRFRPMASYTDLNADGSYTTGEPYAVDDPGQTQSAFMYSAFSAGDYEGFFPVPFTAWDVTDPANPRQLNVVVRDRDQDNAWNLHANTGDPALPNGGDQQYNYTWILNTDYDASGTMYGDGTGGTIDFWSFDGGNGVWDGMWVIWLYERGSSRGQLAEECTFTLVPNLVNSAADQYTFSSAGLQPTEAASGAEALLSEIKTVPNPYYLFSDYDASLDNRNLKFINLPEECTISIYNLSGDLVRTVEKDDATTEAMWDVENDFGIPVGSGIYIYVVDAPGFGTKIGKMAIFTETELLDQF